MNSKVILIVASVILVLILVPFSIFFLGNGVSSQNTPSTSLSSKSVSTSSVLTNVKLTASEVAKHNTESDCSMIVNGKVYDVTTYLPVHPGGASRIIQYCGKDGTQAFDTKGGEGQHSNRANTDLSSLYKGEFSN